MMTPVGRVIVLKSVPKLQLVQAMELHHHSGGAGTRCWDPRSAASSFTYFSWALDFLHQSADRPRPASSWCASSSRYSHRAGRAPRPARLRAHRLWRPPAWCSGFEAIGRGVLPASIILASIAAGAVCSGLYLIHARRTAVCPIIDLGLLRITHLAASISGGGLFYLSTTSSVFLLALLLQLGFGFSAFQAGLMTLASAVGSLAMALHVSPPAAAIGVSAPPHLQLRC